MLFRAGTTAATVIACLAAPAMSWEQEAPDMPERTPRRGVSVVQALGYESLGGPAASGAEE